MTNRASAVDPPIARHIYATPGTHEAVLAMLRLAPGSTILDVGCYQGALSVALLKRGYQVASCDIKAFPGASTLPSFCIADASRGLPYRDASFDAIVCTDVIEHLENPRALIRECSRILRPGGFCVLSTPNVSSFFSRVTFLLQGEFLLFRRHHFHHWDHISPITLIWLQLTAEKYGLTLAAIKTDRVRLSRQRLVLLVTLFPLFLFMDRHHSWAVRLASTIVVGLAKLCSSGQHS